MADKNKEKNKDGNEKKLPKPQEPVAEVPQNKGAKKVQHTFGLKQYSVPFIKTPVPIDYFKPLSLEDFSPIPPLSRLGPFADSPDSSSNTDVDIPLLERDDRHFAVPSDEGAVGGESNDSHDFTIIDNPNSTQESTEVLSKDSDSKRNGGQLPSTTTTMGTDSDIEVLATDGIDSDMSTPCDSHKDIDGYMVPQVNNLCMESLQDAIREATQQCSDNGDDLEMAPLIPPVTSQLQLLQQQEQQEQQLKQRQIELQQQLQLQHKLQQHIHQHQKLKQAQQQQQQQQLPQHQQEKQRKKSTDQKNSGEASSCSGTLYSSEERLVNVIRENHIRIRNLEMSLRQYRSALQAIFAVVDTLQVEFKEADANEQKYKADKRKDRKKDKGDKKKDECDRKNKYK